MRCHTTEIEMARKRKNVKLSTDSSNDLQRVSSSDSDIRSSVDSSSSSASEAMEIKENNSAVVENEGSTSLLEEVSSSQQNSESVIGSTTDGLEIIQSKNSNVSLSSNHCDEDIDKVKSNNTVGDSVRTTKMESDSDFKRSHYDSDSGVSFYRRESSLMPQDIQQIVLGDLTGVTVGQCDEVNSDNDDSSSWEEENVICEEFEGDTESQITEEDVTERAADAYDNSFFVKSDVNENSKNKESCDEIKINDINGNDYDDSKDVYRYSQGGSYEIITVSKESDYENSQESEYFDDENDTELEYCGSINAVLGVDELNCSINISKTNSDDEDTETNCSTVNDNYSDHKLKCSHQNDDNIVSEKKADQVNIIESQMEKDKTYIKESLKQISISGKNKKGSVEKMVVDQKGGGVKKGETNKNRKSEKSLEESKVNSSIAESDVSDSKEVDSFSLFHNFSVKKPSDEETLSSPIDSSKSRVKSEDEEKQPAYRSRSGSSDTTGSGSESGSNSSSGRRRSGRINKAGMSKQSVDKASGKHSNSGSGSPILAPPVVRGFDSDKPVKVKSRWRRSSELEMGSRVSSENSVLTVSSSTASNNISATESVVSASTVTSSSSDVVDTTSDSTLMLPPSSALSAVSNSASSSTPQWPTADTTSAKKDEELEEKLRTFVHLDSNEYHTGRFVLIYFTYSLKFPLNCGLLNTVRLCLDLLCKIFSK